MYTYEYSYGHQDELMHYGVKGMKWGVRRAKLKEAKANYKRSVNDAFARYEKGINKIEAPYKRGQNLSDKDVAREAKVEARYQSEAAAAKAKYKQAKQNIKKESRMTDDPVQNARNDFRDARKNVSKSRSIGAKLATNLFAGAFANRTYNSVIASGGTRVKAAGVTAAATLLGGPIGHLAVSHLYTASAGDKALKR